VLGDDRFKQQVEKQTRKSAAYKQAKKNQLL